LAFKGIWTDRVDGVDIQTADDVNLLARGIIENEKQIEDLKINFNNIETPYIGANGNWFIYDSTYKTYVDSGKKAQGEKGEQGAKGEQGEQGETGPQGEKGDDGYTPKKGTDYWTPTDIAEIKGYVDEAILGGAW
jgi:hypothetical protein